MTLNINLLEAALLAKLLYRPAWDGRTRDGRIAKPLRNRILQAAAAEADAMNAYIPSQGASPTPDRGEQAATVSQEAS